METPRTPEPLPEERRGKRRMWLWFLLALLAIAAVAWMGGRREAPTDVPDPHQEAPLF